MAGVTGTAIECGNHLFDPTPSRHTMYPYSQAVTPAARSHLDAQLAFLNEMSKTWTQSFQHMFDMNVELGRSLIEDSRIAGEQMLAAESPVDAISIATAQAQPMSQRLHTYRHHVSQSAADTQVELARVSEKHVQETSRTAGILADEVKRVAAADEAEQAVRRQQDMLKSVRDPFGSSRPHATPEPGGASVDTPTDGAHTTMQSRGKTDHGSTFFEGNTQGKPLKQSVDQAQKDQASQAGQQPHRKDSVEPVR
jgi:phasin family protein